MKHTKGKWKIRYYHNYGEQKDGEPITPVIVSDEGRVATIVLFNAAIGRQDIADANARRICQCVNNFDKLLEACIKAHDLLLCLHVCDQDKPIADNLRNDLRKAIAESEGE